MCVFLFVTLQLLYCILPPHWAGIEHNISCCDKNYWFALMTVNKGPLMNTDTTFLLILQSVAWTALLCGTCPQVTMCNITKCSPAYVVLACLFFFFHLTGDMQTWTTVQQCLVLSPQVYQTKKIFCRIGQYDACLTLWSAILNWKAKNLGRVRARAVCNKITHHLFLQLLA